MFHASAKSDTTIAMSSSSLVGVVPVAKALHVRAKQAAHTQLAADDHEVELQLRNEHLVGEGAFSRVYRVDMLQAGAGQPTTVAIKRIKHDQHNYERQISIHRCLEHECICCLLYYYPTIINKEIYWNMVLEYMPTSAFLHCNTLAKARLRLDFHSIQIWLCQLLAALAYLHSLDVCHRDVKPENLLVDPTTGRLKLADFGSAKQLAGDQLHSSYQVTRYYRAPELLLGCSRYDVSVDMWATGCIIYELVTGRVLWPGRNSHEQLTLIHGLLGSPSQHQLQEIQPSSRQQRSSSETVSPAEQLVSPDTKSRRKQNDEVAGSSTTAAAADAPVSSCVMPSSNRRLKHSRVLFHFEPDQPKKSWKSRLASDTPDACVSLIDSILQYAPSERPSAAGCLRHPFITPVLTPCAQYIRLRDGRTVPLH